MGTRHRGRRGPLCCSEVSGSGAWTSSWPQACPSLCSLSATVLGGVRHGGRTDRSLQDGCRRLLWAGSPGRHHRTVLRKKGKAASLHQSHLPSLGLTIHLSPQYFPKNLSPSTSLRELATGVCTSSFTRLFSSARAEAFIRYSLSAQMLAESLL